MMSANVTTKTHRMQHSKMLQHSIIQKQKKVVFQCQLKTWIIQ